MKKIKIKVTEKMQKELNDVKRKCGFEEEPIKPEHELDAIFG